MQGYRQTLPVYQPAGSGGRPGLLYTWSKRVALVSLPLFVLLIFALGAQTHQESVFDSPWLLLFLNVLFLSLISFVVAFIAARAYLRSGIIRLLWLGGGALVFGLGNLMAGILSYTTDSANHFVTMHNTTALVAGIFHFVVAALFIARVIIGETHRRKNLRVALVYGALGVFVVALTVATLQDWIPPFFVQGAGPTMLRQIVLGGAVALWMIAAILLFVVYVQTRVEFHFWYALALALSGLGLGAVFFQSATGSLLNWAGRSAQYLGGVYFLAAVLTLIRTGQLRGIALEMQIADFFRESEANYQLLVETLTDALAAVDETGAIFLWNPAAERMFGYTRAEAIGKRMIDLVLAPESAEFVGRERQQFIETGTSSWLGKSIPVTACRKNGETFPAEYTVSTRRRGNRWVATILVRDISERVEAEQAARQGQARLDFALEKSRTGGWDINLVDHTAYRTLEHDRIFGYDSLLPRWTYEMFLEHVLPEDRAEVDARFQRAMATQTDWNFECRIRRADGAVRWIWAVGGHPKESASKVPRMAGIVQDITERKQVEEERERLLAENQRRATELESANRELDAFAYSVSHDLRAPLAFIEQFAHALEEDHGATLGEIGQRYLRLIHDNASAMSHLIENLLRFSRSGRQELRKQPVDMHALVSEVWSELQDAQRGRQIEFVLGSLPSVEGDPALLKQVWTNLMSNALKFTRECQTARIEIGAYLCHPPLEKGEAEGVTYFVKDNGVGFDMDQAHRLFGVFQRLHSAEEYEGTGVGLAIVERIVRRHGGRVWAEGAANQGATFCFTL